MNIQSLSIVVPTGECWNNCAYCVSRMHHEDYGKSILYHNEIPQSYLNRIKFVRDEGCNSMILTGTAEPQQNLTFIYKLLRENQSLPKPFYNISIQTTASGLKEEDIVNLISAGVTTFAISLSSFIESNHWEITNTPFSKRTIYFNNLFRIIKENGANIRACFNLTNEFTSCEPEDYFRWCELHKIDQATFRKIYADGHNEKAEWVHSHEFPKEKFNEIVEYVRSSGTAVSRLPYGFIQYDVNGISTVIDDNCMDKNNIEDMKYMILRPNGHLYSKWDLKGSLVF